MSDDKLNEIRERYDEPPPGEGCLLTHAEVGLLLAENTRLQAIVDKLSKQLEAADELVPLVELVSEVQTIGCTLGGDTWNEIRTALAAFRKAQEEGK